MFRVSSKADLVSNGEQLTEEIHSQHILVEGLYVLGAGNTAEMR